MSASDDPLAELYTLVVHGDGVAEPRKLSALLSRLDPQVREVPICRLADAVITRTGDLEAADVAHRCAVEALVADASAVCVALCSWLGIALARRDLKIMIEIRQRAEQLTAPGQLQTSRGLVATVDAVGLLAAGRLAECERSLVTALAQGVPVQLRGAIAIVRALALQGQGMLDASMTVLDADARWLGSFDFAAELMRARAVWVRGEHSRARSMVAATCEQARSRGRQHDADTAAATARLMALHDGDEPDLPKPTPSTPHVAAMLSLAESIALLPDRLAAAEHLRAHPESLAVAPEFQMVRYVLCPQDRTRLSSGSGLAWGDGVIEAARAVVDGTFETLARRDPWSVRNAYRPWVVAARDGTPARASTARGVPVVGESDSPVPAPIAVVVQVLGDVALVVDGKPVVVRRSRVRTLLVALALQRRTTRERLIELLWPDKSLPAGANNLRTTLSYTRQLVPGCVIVETDGPIVSLSIPVDLWQTDEAARRARRGGTAATTAWVEAADAIGGTFAPATEGEAWLDAARVSVDAGSVDTLVRAAQAIVETDPERARRWAELAATIDPWAERALALVARSWLVVGNVASARRLIDQAEALRADLGTGPSEELDELRRAADESLTSR